MGRPEDIFAHFIPHILILVVVVAAMFVLDYVEFCYKNNVSTRDYDYVKVNDENKRRKKEALKDAMREVMREQGTMTTPSFS